CDTGLGCGTGAAEWHADAEPGRTHRRSHCGAGGHHRCHRDQDDVVPGYLERDVELHQDCHVGGVELAQVVHRRSHRLPGEPLYELVLAGPDHQALGHHQGRYQRCVERHQGSGHGGVELDEDDGLEHLEQHQVQGVVRLE